MAITKNFVALLQGEIHVQSQLGKGSVFSMSIPVSVADEQSIIPAEVPRQIIRLMPDQPVYRLMSVEDNDANRLLLRRVLQSVGIKVREAVNGQEAVELFHEWQPHLVWVDIRMPVMDGFEATRLIRASEEGHQACKIIAATASVFLEDQESLAGKGFDDFLRKPYREAELFSLLEKHLGLQFESQDSLPAAQKEEYFELSEEDIKSVSIDWRKRFQIASRGGKFKDMEALIQEIYSRHPAIAQSLLHLLRAYDLKRLQELSSLKDHDL